MNVAETDIDQGLEPLFDLRDGLEHRQGVGDGKLEKVGDAVTLVLHGEGLVVVAAAATDLAKHIDIGQEVHLDAALAFALAGFAAAPVTLKEKRPAL